MSNNETQILTGEGVDYFRFASIKQQLRMEKAGLKSSGGALRPRLCNEFGLKPRAPHEDYIKYCQDKLDLMIQNKQKEVNEQTQQ